MVGSTGRFFIEQPCGLRADLVTLHTKPMEQEKGLHEWRHARAGGTDHIEFRGMTCRQRRGAEYLDFGDVLDGQ